MSHVLHLVTDPADRTALEVIARQARDPGTRLSVVLLHASTTLAEPVPGLPPERIHRLADGTGSPGAPFHPPITYPELLELIFAADTVVTW